MQATNANNSVTLRNRAQVRGLIEVMSAAISVDLTGILMKIMGFARVHQTRW